MCPWLLDASASGLAPAPVAALPGPAEVRLLLSLIAQRSGAPVVRALCVASELGLTNQLREAIFTCCSSSDAKVRAKAVLLLGQLPPGDGRDGGEAASILSRALGDADARVRASAIEAIERLGLRAFDDVLEQRSRHGHSRERANAIKALAGSRPVDAEAALGEMLRDRRDAHRLGALWVVEKRRGAHLVEEVARIARTDGNARVRSAAIATLQAMLRRMLSPAHRAGRAVA